MKNFLEELKEFISKGDVMSLAIGIIIGAAFTAIINSLVADIISPLLGLIIGGVDFASLSFGISDAQIMYGNFIQAIIIFILTALVIFVIMKNVNKMKERKAKEKAEEPKPEPVLTAEETLLMEIRDLLKENREVG